MSVRYYSGGYLTAEPLPGAGDNPLRFHCLPGDSDDSIRLRLYSEPDLDEVERGPEPAEVPPGFSEDLSNQQLQAIGKIASGLDASLGRALRRGKAVSVVVPTASPIAPESHLATTARECWAARQRIGSLIRPLLLKAPDTSHLFDYQRDGVEWMASKREAVLADDMGLGKTLQTITALRVLIANGLVENALVVCPKSLLSNWSHEIARWAPELSHLSLAPSSDERDACWEAIAGRVHVLIVNYEQLRNAPQQLVERQSQTIVADEAHRIRNLTSSITRSIRQIEAERFWALTGTPVERDARDLAVLLSTVAPRRFSPTDASLPISRLRSLGRPYILRRTKEAVLDQLPDAVDSLELLELSPAQRHRYDAIRNRSERNQSLISQINDLRRICDIDETSGESSKLDRIEEILDNVKSIGEKAVVFSYLLAPLRELSKRLSERVGSRTLEGSMGSAARNSAVQDFLERSDVTALLASSRVAGEGLTLTAANHVIFVNEWWNPSANAQARDRVVRIGQTRGVRIYRFCCADTVEESLQRILAQKSEVFGRLVERLADGEAQEGELQPLLAEIGKVAS